MTEAASKHIVLITGEEVIEIGRGVQRFVYIKTLAAVHNGSLHSVQAANGDG